MDVAERRRFMTRNRVRKWRMKNKLIKATTQNGSSVESLVAASKVPFETFCEAPCAATFETENDEVEVEELEHLPTKIEKVMERREVQLLRTLSLRENFKPDLVNELLDILRDNLMPELPHSAEEFLQVPIKSELTEEVLGNEDPLSMFGINLSSNETNDSRQIDQRLKVMEAKIDKICCTQDKMVNFFENLLGKYGENEKTSVGITEVMLPCQTYEDFMLLEKKLKKSEASKKKFREVLLTFINKRQPFSQVLTNILKNYISRDVAMYFSNNCLLETQRLDFMETCFAKTIIEFLTNVYYNEVSSTDMISTMNFVLQDFNTV